MLQRAARATASYVVIGMNEHSPVSLGALYNTLVEPMADGAAGSLSPKE